MIYELTMAFTSLWIVRTFWGIFFEKKKATFWSVASMGMYFAFQALYLKDSANIHERNILINLFFMYFIAVCGYHCKGREKYFLLTSLCAVWLLFEFVAYILVIGIDREREFTHMLGTILSKIFMIVLLFFLSLFWKKRGFRYIPGKFYLFSLLVPAGSIAVSLVLFFSGNSVVVFGIVLGFLLLFNLVIFEAYVQMEKACGEKMEQEVLRRQIAMYRNEFEIIQESDKSIRLLRHDLKKHLLLLSAYMEEGRYEKAGEYVKELGQELFTEGEYVKTGNGSVDSIVNYMLAKAEKQGAKIQVSLQVPQESFMPDFDLNILLGNLFENALEALEKVERGRLDFYMSYDRQVLYISLCNSFDGKVKKSGNAYLTTKQEKGDHGMGILAMEHIVKKYSGEMKMEHTDIMFGTDIILYV